MNNKFSEEMLSYLRESVKNEMGEKRYFHTLEVEKMAARLGEIYAPEQISMLRAAALLHDITKERTTEEHIVICENAGEIVSIGDRKAPKMFHSRTAALVIPSKYPEFDTPEIISAVRYHTTGRENMTLAEKIIYEYFDCFGIGYLLVIAVSKSCKSLKKSLFNELVKELYFLRTVFHNVTNDELYHIPSELHIVVKVGKCDLGFDHPELCRVSCGIGVLCAEGRTECVYLTVCKSVGLALKLSRNGEVCGFAEEVLREVYASVFLAGRVVHVQCCNSEHLACTLTVRCCNDRGMNVNESSVVEELVNSEGSLASYSEHSREQIGSGAQISLLAKELNSVALGLKGIFRSRSTLDLDGCSLYFKGLLHCGGKLNDTLYNYCRTYVLLCNFVIVSNFLALKNYLNAFKAASVIKVNEAKGLAVAQIAHPTAEDYFLAREALDIFVYGANKISFHFLSPFIKFQLIFIISPLLAFVNLFAFLLDNFILW